MVDLDNELFEDGFTEEDADYLYQIFEALINEYGETLDTRIDPWNVSDQGAWYNLTGGFLDYIQDSLHKMTKDKVNDL